MTTQQINLIISQLDYEIRKGNDFNGICLTAHNVDKDLSPQNVRRVVVTLDLEDQVQKRLVKTGRPDGSWDFCWDLSADGHKEHIQWLEEWKAELLQPNTEEYLEPIKD